MANRSSEIKYASSKITIGLPLTSPTGKIRIKKRINGFGVGLPFASRQTPISEDCYVEWQIGYDTPEPNIPGVSKEVAFIRKGEQKYGYELSSMLFQGLKRKIFSPVIVQKLIDFAESLSEEDFIEENATIERKLIHKKNIKGIDFDIIEEKYPLYFFDKKEYVIEVEVKHKQRAVGYQSMVYICLPIKIFHENIVGRIAEQREFATFDMTETKNNFIFDLFKVFSLASKQHNKDILNILKAIKAKLGE